MWLILRGMVWLGCYRIVRENARFAKLSSWKVQKMSAALRPKASYGCQDPHFFGLVFPFNAARYATTSRICGLVRMPSMGGMTVMGGVMVAI